MRVNNLRPEKCAKFLIDNGWEFVNREGTHETYYKVDEDGKVHFVQVICNNKTIYWKNAAEMIKRSGIPGKEWIKNCK